MASFAATIKEIIMADPNKKVEGIIPESKKTGIDAESQPSETRPTGQTEEGGVREPSGGFLKLPPRLSNLLQAFQARTEGAMRAFRLPGSNRVIHDRREAGHRGEKDIPDKAHTRPDRADKHRREMHIREGRAEDVKARTYENYLAIRQMTASEKGPEAKLKEKLLSEFEKLLVERFEQAKKIEEESKDGKAKFLAKTVEEWRAFFDKFLHRTVKKTADLAEIQEFLFRGMVKKGDAKAVLISDIILNSGRTDKFARFGVLYHKISDFLSKLLPGDAVAKNAIADALLSERLMYLALQPPSAESEILTGLKPKQGMFAAESTEARVAEELGISYDKGAPSAVQRGLYVRGKKKRAGGLFKWLSSDEEMQEDAQGRFMPWWQWGTLKKPGGFTLKRALYSGVFILFILVVLFLIDRFLIGK